MDCETVLRQERPKAPASAEAYEAICLLVARARRGDRGPAPQPSRWPIFARYDVLRQYIAERLYGMNDRLPGVVGA